MKILRNKKHPYNIALIKFIRGRLWYKFIWSEKFMMDNTDLYKLGEAGVIKRLGKIYKIEEPDYYI